MKAFDTTIEINADPETIWGILTDSTHYPDWDENMIRMEGNIAPNEQLVIYTQLAPERAFKPTVTEFEANRRMVWRSGMPMGLFQGVRTFTLESLSAGKTRFSMREEFSGLLLPLFGRSIPDMNPVFARYSQALKERAENAT